MNVDNFYLEFKSTLDYLMNQIRTELQAANPAPLHLVDINDISGTDDKLKSPDACLLYELISLDPTPFHPLYTAQFAIGVKTGTEDVGGYTLSELLAKLNAKFTVGSQMEIADYSTKDMPTSTTGYMYVLRRPTDAQQFDHQSAIRFSVVTAKATSYG